LQLRVKSSALRDGFGVGGASGELMDTLLSPLSPWAPLGEREGEGEQGEKKKRERGRWLRGDGPKQEGKSVVWPPAFGSPTPPSQEE
jgi:hypothetical protein